MGLRTFDFVDRLFDVEKRGTSRATQGVSSAA